MVKKLFRRARRAIKARRAPVTKSQTRRRLQPGVLMAGAGLALAKKGRDAYQSYRLGIRRAQRTQWRKAQARATTSIQQSDNITSLAAFKIGTPRPDNFQEKVERIANPPVIFKRQYACSCEVDSGRKAFFGYPINDLNSSLSGSQVGLYEDIMVQAGRLTTDTATVNPTISTGGQINNRFYIDYYSNKLQMINSGTNSLTGKVTLYKYKRDTDIYFTNVTTPMTPINLMGLFSTNNLTAINSGYEATVGNGWKFDGSTSKSNYNANYTLPGSVLNVGGVCLQTDLDLQPMSKHIQIHSGHFFKEVAQNSFSLKPGQQINQYTIMNDLPDIQRYAVDMTYIKDTSFYLVVEFQAGIVGDSTPTTGSNIISTGSGQLSCVMEEKRIVGIRGRNTNGKVVMVTQPLTQISKAVQYTINPDTGLVDAGYEEDE